MKISQWAATSAAVITICTIASTPCDAKRRKSTSGSTAGTSNNGNTNPGGTNTESMFPALPSGWISAFPTIVQTGTKPTLTWGINYPSIVEDYITITDPSTITADEEVDCEIRVLGAGVTVSSSNRNSFSFVPTETRVSNDGGSYGQIFYGTNDDVNPSEVVYTATLAKHDTLKFSGRYYYNRRWGPYFTSDSGTQNIRSLVNGSTPPTNVPEYNAPSLESFIKPYLNASNKVNIGPMDVIVFMELTHYDSQSTSSGYDLQDMVLLVTFKAKAKTNNGHGNNIDGIDSSNPGSAPFINLDTDPTVDDEGSGGGAAPSNP